MWANLFFPGDTRFCQAKGRDRSLWREFELMLFLVKQTITPKLSLKSSIMNWHEISIALREPPRKRVLQAWQIEAMRGCLF